MKLKKFFCFSSVFLCTTLIAPTLMACAQKDFVSGKVDEDNSNDNEVSDKKEGVIDKKIFNSLDKDVNLFKKNVIADITFKDYNLASIDSTNNTYKFIHERGGLVDKSIKSDIKINKDDFISNFNFKSFFVSANKPKIDNKPLFGKLIKPTSDLFLDDLNVAIYKQWLKNNRSFNIEIIDDKNIQYNFDESTLDFEYKLKISSAWPELIKINLFGYELELFPGVEYVLSLKTHNSKIINVVNFSSDRFFLGWKLRNVSLSFGSKNEIINDFLPYDDSYSNAFQVEFLNLSNEKNYLGIDNSSIKNYMFNLKESTVEDAIKKEIKNNTDVDFLLAYSFGELFNVLSQDVTVGEFFDKIADPIGVILQKLNVVPQNIINLIKDIFKSFNNGAGILTLLENNKSTISQLIASLLDDALGDVTELLELVLSPFNSNMTQEDKDQVLFLIDKVIPDENIKKVFKEVLNMLFDNPFSLDFFQWLFKKNENLIKLILAIIGFKNGELDAILKIVSPVFDRDQLCSGDKCTTIIKDKKINYKNKVLNVLLGNDKTSETVRKELVDNLKKILKGFQIDIDSILGGIINQLIEQLFIKNNNLSVENVTGVFKEISSLLLFLSNKQNVNIQTFFEKDVEFIKQPKNNKDFLKLVDFNYVNKISFNKEFVFNLSSIFNLLPKSVNIPLQLTNNLKTNIEIPFFNIFRMFPRSIVISPGDAIEFYYEPVDNKIIYNQFFDNNNYYHGFSILLKRTQKISQLSQDKGIISDWLSNFFDESDWIKKGQNNFINKEVNAENEKIAINQIQTFLANQISSSFYLDYIDKQNISVFPYIKNSYYNGYTFKWNDLDIFQQPIGINLTSPNDPFKNFQSQQFNSFFNNISEQNIADPNKFNYQILKPENGELKKVKGTIESKRFVLSNVNDMKNQLYTLGNQIKEEDIVENITPIFKHQFTKTVVKTKIVILDVKVKVHVQLMAFKVDLLMPYNVLDLSNMQRKGDNDYSLSNFKFSNNFSKIIFAPRIAISL